MGRDKHPEQRGRRSQSARPRQTDSNGSPAEPTEKFDPDAASAPEPPTWLRRAADRYEQRQQQYASLLGEARHAVEQEKQELSTFFTTPGPEGDSAAETEPPPPAIFDEAARAYQERQKSLGSLFSEAVQAKQQEREALKNLFGRPPGQPGGGSRDRRR